MKTLTGARNERGTISLGLATLASVGLAAAVTAGAMTLNASAAAPQPAAAPAAVQAPLTPSADALLAAKAAPAPATAPAVKQKPVQAKQAPAKMAAAAVAAAPAASGPGAGCMYGYRVSAPGVWADDQQGQQHMSVEFVAGLTPVPELAAQEVPNTIDCPQYDALHEAFIDYLIGDGNSEGAYVHEQRYRDGERPFRVPIHTLSPYDPQVPGARTIAMIERDSQTPREVADGIDAWMAQTYPGATRECVMVDGVDPEPAVKTGRCWPGYP